jgi:hypothetical protein
MTLIGPVIEKQQKIINDCVEKKLALSKLQSSIWEKTNNTKESFSISDINVDDDIFKDLMERDINKTDNVYKMKK